MTFLKLPNNYEDNYERARLTYRHHTVFDVYTGRAVPLMPLGRYVFYQSHIVGNTLLGDQFMREIP